MKNITLLLKIRDYRHHQKLKGKWLKPYLKTSAKYLLVRINIIYYLRIMLFNAIKACSINNFSPTMSANYAPITGCINHDVIKCRQFSNTKSYGLASVPHRLQLFFLSHHAHFHAF